MIRTSISNPIRLDPILSGPEHKSVLYLTLAPGKKSKPYNYPKSGYQWDRDLNTDLDRMRNVYGIHYIVSLLEPDEADKIGLGFMGQRTIDKGFGFISYPIRDLSIPTDLVSFHQLILKIHELLRNGYSISLSCLGGQGRGPTVGASVLILAGMSVNDAINWVKKQRKGSLKRKKQQKFLQTYADYLKIQN